MSQLAEVNTGTASIDRFRDVLTKEQWERLERTAARTRRDFAGRVIWTINSTARGGGVAELLSSLVPYCRAGVDVRWLVIHGDQPFFRLTKRLHNITTPRLRGWSIRCGSTGPRAARIHGDPSDDSPPLLVDPSDLDGFAETVVGLLEDPARAEWLGHNARERVRGAFLGARHLKQYVDLFGGLVRL